MGAVFYIDLALVGLGLYILKLLFTPKKTPAPLPPGPKGKPLVGNVADLPKPGEQEWMHWLKLKEQYGPISSLTVMGMTMILLHDSRIAFDLMEKRSALHSSRPRMVFGGEMCGWDNALSSQYYSDRFRAYRKNVHGLLGSKWAVARLYPIQEVEVRRFLLRVLDEPDQLLQHIRTEAGAIILKIAYGYTIEPHKRDPLVDLADEALIQFSLATVPGAWLVDIMPFLKYVPDWFPGASFKRTAGRWKRTITELAEKPYAFVRNQMAAGTNEPSYLSKLLEKGNLTPEEDFVAKWTALSLYAGGADTTVSTIACFYLAMTIYPEVQRKAQEEIDRVVGTDRLPGFEDRENLPYVDAIVKEALRWHPVAPMGLPHVTSEDDMYEGYFIPKGSLVIPNIWAFMHDPAVFRDPMTFNPERFLGAHGEAEPDPHTFSFGFGRRICPGRELADASVYLTIAQTLAVFRIGKAVGEDGREVEPVVRFQPGVISHPAPYRNRVEPRSGKHEALIRSFLEEHPWQESDAKELENIKV